MQPDQQKTQIIRLDLPPHGGEGQVTGDRPHRLRTDHWGGSRMPALGDTDLGLGPRQRGGMGRTVVEVHAEHIDRGADQLHIAIAHVTAQAGLGHVLDHVGGILTFEDRVEEDPVEPTVDTARGINITRVVRIGGMRVGRVAGDAHRQVLFRLTEHLHTKSVRQQQVLPSSVGQERGAPGLVQGGPHLDTIPQRIDHVPGVFGEQIGGVTIGPAAPLPQGLWQIPVIERQPWLDPGGQQLVNEPGIEVQAGGVEGPAVGAHTGPRSREPVGVQVQFAHQGDVLGHPMVVVTRHHPVGAVADPAWDLTEGVPDRGSPPIGIASTLDLEGRGGRPKQEIGGELQCGHPFTAPCMMPETSCLPATMKTRTSGIVEITTPDMISE